MSDCIFCKIAAKEVPANFAYEDDDVIAFSDLAPQAPVHILVIPKKHIESLLAVGEEDKKLLSHIMVDVVPQIAREKHIDEKGFRVVINTGDDGGQTVKHLHVHILGDRSMQWPPG